jgi:hypothetical protein
VCGVKSSFGSFRASLLTGIYVSGKLTKKIWASPKLSPMQHWKKQLRNDLTVQLCGVLKALETFPTDLLRVSLYHQLGLNVLITETSLS